ncbi:Hypothetical protein, putative [Bodo saltans]|uniref:Uncharacterized protein n=1 Tax=Bodo saltans TaxID=75058 RepID=A0A0S4IVG8_BODSA|nr:Hypothetical protein, putative [Bodo saltans]|eukprot:CUG18822.1 Hypothetical protein, putative [Bodo saltans]
MKPPRQILHQQAESDFSSSDRIDEAVRHVSAQIVTMAVGNDALLQTPDAAYSFSLALVNINCGLDASYFRCFATKAVVEALVKVSNHATTPEAAQRVAYVIKDIAAFCSPSARSLLDNIDPVM